MEKDVKIYTTPTCPHCKRAKEFLKEKNVEFEEINVAKNKEKAKEMVEKTGQRGVPVIEIGDETIIGFDQDGIEKALEE